MNPPVQYAFGIHLHQPVGNFDGVFAEHLDSVYAPLLTALEEGDAWPVSLHLSGPLLDWLETHAPTYLDRLGRHVADRQIELLLAGYDEPVLAVLPREDRLEQIARLRDALQRRFGAEARGLWLTERVWEPGLVEDLVDAGVQYVLLDDRHFLATGCDRDALHRPYRTESGGKRVAVFPIDERLRYLVPFRPHDELARYFEALWAAGAPLAVLADDGEKFGGWPGTREWVYERGWMRDYTATLRGLRERGIVRLVTFGEALRTIDSGGLIYLPTASYREMEGWSLPEPAAVRLATLERDLGEARMAGPDGALVRGGHWRNFLVKYTESNRMHKKMIALSQLCRSRGDPTDARRAIGRAQCNDAYWHGVFGGLYLPHLRHAIWRELARAEARLRAGEPLAYELIDIDADGREEIWLHGAHCSAVVSPHRGGGIEELTLFGSGRNLADTLTRRREPYHRLAQGAEHHAGESGGAPSIHDLEKGLSFSELPPFDATTRAILQEYEVAAEPDDDAIRRAAVSLTRDWRSARARAGVRPDGDALLVTLEMEGLTKRIRIAPDGALAVELIWDGAPADASSAFMLTELSLGWPADVRSDADRTWTYAIETVSKSERGFDRTSQGTATVLGWRASRGRGQLTVAGPAED